MTQFSDLGLAEPILRALGNKGYDTPTPIQLQAIPALLQGRDLLGIAQTGTGKTAAFSLPSIQRLADNPEARQPASCRMLVLSPTRELAAQIAENMRNYSQHYGLHVHCIFGGVPASRQARALQRGCDILVATPGRLLDLIDQRALTLRQVSIFVLDEADQMMDLGFIKPLTRIAGMLPKERQSLFFSATMPKAIAELGKRFIQNPVRVEVTPQATTAERVEQYSTFLNQKEKQALLTMRLRAGFEDGSIDRVLVFTRTKHGANRVARHLNTADIRADAIHGNKSQAQRVAAIKAFRAGESRVLIATDIAARGIDIPGVSHVFNFELPNVPEQYVHRIGRTARAGADGVAISFVAPDEKDYLRGIERLTGVKLTPMPLPENFQQEAARLPLPSKKDLEQDGEEKPFQVRQPRGRDGQRSGGRDGQRGGARGGRPQRSDSRRRGDDSRGGRRFDVEGQGGWKPELEGDARPNRSSGNERGRAPRTEGRRDGSPRENGGRDRARHDGQRPTSARRDDNRGEKGFDARPRNPDARDAGPRDGKPRNARPHGERSAEARPQREARPERRPRPAGKVGGDAPQRRRGPKTDNRRGPARDSRSN